MRTFKQYLIVGIFAGLGVLARADIVSELQKIETVFAEPFYLAGENSMELTPEMQVRKDNLEMRLRYPEAWKMYSRGEIGEFSYFGFKLYDVESGKLPLEKFLRELQQTIK